ncbi:hypothetical protein BDC45DRAFT_558758 [Circinella umbellata]|nr:hypothetical protein BDC45DRAFT_558758 [Circinella umbellata]
MLKKRKVIIEIYCCLLAYIYTFALYGLYLKSIIILIPETSIIIQIWTAVALNLKMDKELNQYGIIQDLFLFCSIIIWCLGMTPLALLWSVSSKHLLSFSFTSYTLLYLLVIYILVYYAQLLGPRHWAYSRYRSVKVCNITICLRVVYFEAIYLTDFLLIFYSIVYILVQELFLSFSIIDYISKYFQYHISSLPLLTN